MFAESQGNILNSALVQVDAVGEGHPFVVVGECATVVHGGVGDGDGILVFIEGDQRGWPTGERGDVAPLPDNLSAFDVECGAGSVLDLGETGAIEREGCGRLGKEARRLAVECYRGDGSGGSGVDGRIDGREG